MIKSTRKEKIIQSTIIELCALISAIENGITPCYDNDRKPSSDGEMLSVKETLDLLGIPESSIQRLDANGEPREIDWASIPIGFDKASVLSLVNEV